MEKPEKIQKRIKSISDTQKITRAMKMIASSKIKKAQSRILEARDFISGIENIISDIACYSGFVSNPLLKSPGNDKNVLIVGITSDRGLCGGYNSNIIRQIEKSVNKLIEIGKKVKLIIIGTRGKNYFKYIGYDIDMVYENLSDHPKFLDAREISKHIISRYVEGNADRVLLCYTEFINPAENTPVIMQLLPISNYSKSVFRDVGKLINSIIDIPSDSPHGETEGTVSGLIEGKVCRIFPEFVYDPSLSEILDAILPEYIDSTVYGALLDSTASETGARITAMKSASDNAADIIKELINMYHKARQQEITLEIAEIVSGAGIFSS